ncbi:Hypothetical predicted protein [Olea europaea subsp. europaea]|uniref:Uncharacterized protein n=1 Tax=Olea europaea subsp. europaea TaxID=158383 RepID=A0A8S0SDD0_OLEEU|nr:Hypothetical predicted protein [Olea europaea subsp. europaea]
MSIGSQLLIELAGAEELIEEAIEVEVECGGSRLPTAGSESDVIRTILTKDCSANVPPFKSVATGVGKRVLRMDHVVDHRHMVSPMIPRSKLQLKAAAFHGRSRTYPPKHDVSGRQDDKTIEHTAPTFTQSVWSM